MEHLHGGNEGILPLLNRMNTSNYQKPLTESGLTDRRYEEGVRQLRNAVERRCLTKGEAGIHVLGAAVLKSFRQDADNFADVLISKLNETICQTPQSRFRAGSTMGNGAQEVLDAFAKEKEIELVSSCWLELIDNQERLSDSRLIGLFRFPNGRRAVAVFQLFS